MENGMFDVMVPTENNNGSVPATLLMDKKDLNEYLDKLNNYYEVSYYELYNLDNVPKNVLIFSYNVPLNVQLLKLKLMLATSKLLFFLSWQAMNLFTYIDIS